MKKLFAVMLLLAASAFAQAATHSVTLTWTDPNSTASTDTYNEFRATGACPVGGGLGTLSFTQLNSSPTTTQSYVDGTVAAATTYCYYVVAVNGSSSSAPSVTAQGAVPALFEVQITTTVVQ